MNFVRLVEDGTYNKEDLNDSQRDFVNGMEFLAEQVNSAIDLAFDNFRIDDEMETFNKLLDEFEKILTDDVQEFLDGEICEAIVELGDENACEEADECE